jgi:hypothetical protein
VQQTYFLTPFIFAGKKQFCFAKFLPVQFKISKFPWQASSFENFKKNAAIFLQQIMVLNFFLWSQDKNFLKSCRCNFLQQPRHLKILRVARGRKKFFLRIRERLNFTM